MPSDISEAIIKKQHIADGCVAQNFPYQFLLFHVYCVGSSMYWIKAMMMYHWHAYKRWFFVHYCYFNRNNVSNCGMIGALSIIIYIYLISKYIINIHYKILRNKKEQSWEK
jgi:hypothetical protein